MTDNINRILKVQNTKLSTKRASFITENDELDDNFYLTIFNFIGLPSENDGTLKRIVISTPFKSWVADTEVTLQYESIEPPLIVFQTKQDNNKAMSIVTSETANPYLIIDAIVNQMFAKDDTFNLALYKFQDTSILYPDVKNLPMDYISWAIIQVELAPLQFYSIRIENPKDVTGSPISYFTFK